MVVKMHKQNTNLKPSKLGKILLEITLNYLKSYLLLKIKIHEEKIYSHLFITLLLNILSTTLFLGVGWSLLIYFNILLAFCGINSVTWFLCEGDIKEKKSEESGLPSHDTNGLPSHENRNDPHSSSNLPSSPFITLLFYFYISLLGLSYLPLYLYISHKSSFLKPVVLVIFMGVYTIFYLNNTKKDPITLILITINILIIIYLCIDHLELGK
ncbi:hypothetical protein NBO_46g0002 [Nosema bombycis CQ1]|uniref:Uncharacterized protein n=1 Tax=Nosema bombycis (strain CQ1 / CVCC 102059) TaxID=578461 RepID=R0KUT0_NOSB1|nr:hypothetical protein NBO_46g0002 [Nosema bombycis CQ1]|eukprot:EOB13967.1 hypothetical protein NBO_46g0002 [Nosema bombycis CQ1]